MLVAAPLRWDEVCFAVPALRALNASGLKIGILCPAEQREFWETLPELALIELPPSVRSLLPKVRGKWASSLCWDVGPAAQVARLAEIPRRIGPPAGRFIKHFTHPLEFSEKPTEHRVWFYLSALEKLGIPTVKPEFFVPVNIGISPVKGAVLLSPESDFGGTHEWPIERWKEIGERLLAAGCRVTVAGMRQKRGSLAQTLAAELGSEVEFFHAAPLAGTMPLLAVHELVVAADGHLPHLASHVGATCVTLFGPNDPQWKRPMGKRHAMVRHHVECAPCLLARCRLDMRCQRELEIERVWAAVKGKLGLAD